LIALVRVFDHTRRKSMKALAIRRYGAPLEMMDLPRPDPGPGDLLVRVRAASVNPVDYKIRDGGVKVLLRYSFPLILGNDLAGDVEAVGPGVTRFKVGDPIYSRLDKDRIGAFAEYALVRESAAAKKPARLDYVEAASLPLVGLTAWQILVDLANLRAGQQVLIHAGSGGVGTFAIQLAKHLGAHVTTTASARNHALVKSLGADEAIDYKTTRFEEVVKDQDVVFDTQGGDTLLRSFDAVKRGGVVLTVGGRPDAKFARAWGLSLPLVWLLGFLNRKVDRRAREKHARFEYLFMHASGEQLEKVGALVEQGVIKPVLDRTFPLEAAADAVAHVESGKAVGKVVLRVAD
jgi:alcohol dehydrogenase